MGQLKRKLRSRQVAALPVRVGLDGATEVLLITSRDTGRWVIPKGWPMSGKSDCDAAAIEALEEAGAVGVIDPEPLGCFNYFKRQTRHFDLVEVTVYRLCVHDQLTDWREKGERQSLWVTPERAAELVQEPELAALLMAAAPG